jgi:hypothetical protein
VGDAFDIAMERAQIFFCQIPHVAPPALSQRRYVKGCTCRSWINVAWPDIKVLPFIAEAIPHLWATIARATFDEPLPHP